MTTYPPPDVPYAGPAAHYGHRENKPIVRIVLHSTVSPCKRGYAAVIARYFRTTSRAASAHYVVDPGITLQVVWDSLVAYHAPPNDGSIGIEMCDMPSGNIARWGDRPHRRMLARTARLVAELCLAYDVPVKRVKAADLVAGADGICGHVDVTNAWHQTTHTDPGAFPWRLFMRLVRREVGTITGTRKATRLRNAAAAVGDAVALLAGLPATRVRPHRIADDLQQQKEALEALVKEIEG